MDTKKSSELRNRKNTQNRKNRRKMKLVKHMVTSLLLGLILFLGACAPKGRPLPNLFQVDGTDGLQLKRGAGLSMENR